MVTLTFARSNVCVQTNQSRNLIHRRGVFFNSILGNLCQIETSGAYEARRRSTDKVEDQGHNGRRFIKKTTGSNNFVTLFFKAVFRIRC